MATIHHSARRAPIRNTQSGQSPERQPASDERKLREERLLDAATTLLVHWGYRKTTIDDVAREAGVGKGTIYLHWKDKNDLFRAAIWREQHRYSEEVRTLGDKALGCHPGTQRRPRPKGRPFSQIVLRRYTV